MKRNVEKTIARGRSIADKHHRIDLSMGEYIFLREQLAENCKSMGLQDATFKAITEAYYLGLATGATFQEKTREKRGSRQVKFAAEKLQENNSN